MRVRGPIRAAARGRIRALLAALGLACFCIAAVPRQWGFVTTNLEFGRAHVSDPLPVARRVGYGQRFMRGIDTIAAAIPPDGSYGLVDGNDEKANGFFVRSALAPRRARYLGVASSVDSGALRILLSVRPTPFVVLAWQADGPPTLVDARGLSKSPP